MLLAVAAEIKSKLSIETQQQQTPQTYFNQ